ncbi:MAG: sigma-70 family RNA polymerase sigma factor [Burkholderiaceae bacterium]|nr:sigma-70 family RNA polymerase sigma factor [Burkholderiaceae bacterium]
MTIEHQLEQHRTYLLRFARLQLRNDAWAEDAVSETLLAALSKPQAFENKSQLKTWLVGILKHKVIDVLRVQTREASINFEADGDGSEELDALMFQQDGHFVSMPLIWDAGNTSLGDNPVQRLSSQQFFQVLEACTDKLPPAQGRIFLMREWLELSVEEICKELNLTSTNLYVQLHRARLRLRECLEINWFGNTRHEI